MAAAEESCLNLQFQLLGKLRRLGTPPSFVNVLPELREFQPNQTYIYNPLEYNADIMQEYYRRYANGPKRVLFLGMNLGSVASLRTGIPFGDMRTVQKLMQLQAVINEPPLPRDLIREPLDEPDSSSTRFWNLIQALYNDAGNFMDMFFEDCFVANFCPLAFLDCSGKNVSLQELPKGNNHEHSGYIEQMKEGCLENLQQQVDLLNPDLVIAMGHYVKNILKGLENARALNIVRINHPSRRTGISEREWIRDSKTTILNEE
ncbi:single-strand selective monofunctional uracil DNA glycosylase-like, partial [Musca vetustissima]|uniref:single-strand selective monofunctional uracil DNA glycosylase-like n=1 Tax=Musca vetustissima TaxID=27455 RepID=UPI002AB6CC40